MHRFAALALLSAALLSPALVRAEVSLRQPLTPFEARDLDGRDRSSAELAGKPSVIIVMLDPRAASAVHQWFDAVIAQRFGERIHLIGVLALDVAFFIPWSAVAGSVRGDVPRTYWSHAWVDAHGEVSKALGLDPDSAEPYVITTDADGEVTSISRGAPTSEALARIAEALGLPPPEPSGE